MEKLPKSISRSLFTIVQLLQSLNGQELEYVHALLQQQLDEGNSVVDQCIHHSLGQTSHFREYSSKEKSGSA